MTRTICPDCGGALSAGLLYGLAPEPTDCLICWECGYQVPPVYRRSRWERNEYAPRFDGECRACGGTTTARGPHLLRALCDDCYATRRVADRAAAIRGVA